MRCIRGWTYDSILEPLLKSMKEWVAEYIQKRQLTPALDICCGTGAQCRRLLDRNIAARGLDLDGAVLKYATSKHRDLSVVCADAAAIPFREGSFKSIILSYALHDKPPALRRRMIFEAERILASGGVLIVVDFENPWNWTSRLGRLFVDTVELIAGVEHFRNGREFLKKGGLEAFLKAHRLEVIESLMLPWSRSRIAAVRF